MQHENLFIPSENGIICGLDEAGRGPLAGPVYAACVILPSNFPKEFLNDSKKLNETRREAARLIIMEHATAYGIGIASETEIDTLNILQASLLAMHRAYIAMNYHADFAWIDGNKMPVLPIPGMAKPKADATIFEVMAASILAKTYRDRCMERWDSIYPEYGYAKHKGYPTKAHREICHKIGPSPIQRLSFNY